VFVYSTNVLTSAQYAIDQNVAPILSMSYGACELAITSNSSGANVYRSVAQQANAQGITWLASSGDSGSAGCDRNVAAGTKGKAVEIPASVPEVTAVGGTEFNEGSGTYWSNTNAPGTGGSALSYIPEKAWNDTALAGSLSATGGGTSIFFPKPSWQVGQNVPNDNARDVPDISFAASPAHDFYLVVSNGSVAGIGGTSAATPVFAGMLALLNQSLRQTKPGLGNINPNLYRLAQTVPNIFHDVTVGSNIVPCAPGTTGCTNGTYGYSAGPGYDQATGLGSVDMNALVTNWNGTSSAPSTVSTTTTLGANPASIVVNGSTVLTATIRAASGTASPTGSVTFNAGKTALGSATLSGSGGTATAALTVFGSQLSIGANAVTVSYDGTTTFAPSSGSATVTLTVPTTSSAVVVSIVPNPVYQQAPDADGYQWFYTVRLTEVGGAATTLSSFSIGGTDHTSDIPGWFGSNTLAARGTLSASIRSIGLTVPVNRVFVLNGTDGNGQKWTQQITVPFLPQQISASMALSSSPGTEVQNPKGDPACSADHPFYQQLNVQEQNGFEVQLTKFLAGGNDLSSNIQTWFGTLRLAPLGALRANLCWQIGSLPANLSYELDGVDTAGNKITATLSVPFKGPGQSPGALTTSKSNIALTAAAGQTSTTTVAVNVPAGEAWTMSPFPANQKSSWLVAYPQSATGTATVNLVLSAAGLASGVYTANLVFQSVNTIPQFVNVPVTFTIGASSSVVISGVTNGASFLQTFAPGMILSIFGSRLANSTKPAPSVPLPTTLDGVSVTVNGVSAPLYFISPGQLNVQIPYETPAGTAVLGVNNNGLVNSFNFPVKATAPGIFTGSDGAIVPISSARRGQSILLYITGDGETTPALATGAPPANSTPISGLPAPRAALSMSVGGIAVTPFFVGIPYGLVGVTQVNFTVPSNAPLGIQPVTVSVGGVASKTTSLNITPTAATAESVPPLFPAAGFLPFPVLPLELSLPPVSVRVSGEERDVPWKP
jgi:uncharacterized protein (TIGR03437 family)